MGGLDKSVLVSISWREARKKEGKEGGVVGGKESKTTRLMKSRKEEGLNEH